MTEKAVNDGSTFAATMLARARENKSGAGEKIVTMPPRAVDGPSQGLAAVAAALAVPEESAGREPPAASSEASAPEPSSDDAAPPSSDPRRPGAKLVDFTSALDLINEASEAIRISEERAEELEAELRRVIEQASDEVRRLNAEIVAGEQRLAQTEDRLRASEARMNEAETWLARLHEAVVSAFSPLQQDRRATVGKTPGRPSEAARD